MLLRFNLFILMMAAVVAAVARDRIEPTASGLFDRIQAQDSVAKSVSVSQMIAEWPDSVTFSALPDLARRLLYEPDSPQADDETFLAVADLLLTHNRLSDSDRTRLEYMKETAMLNRVGHRAADFEIRMFSGAVVRLSDLVKAAPLTILLFYDPDCEDCAELENRLMNGLRPGVGVVMVSPYGEQDGLWARHAATMPDAWSIGLPLDDDFEDSGLYDIRSTPSLLLIDRNMTVITKKIADVLSSDDIVTD